MLNGMRLLRLGKEPRESSFEFSQYAFVSTSTSHTTSRSTWSSPWRCSVAVAIISYLVSTIRVSLKEWPGWLCASPTLLARLRSFITLLLPYPPFIESSHPDITHSRSFFGMYVDLPNSTKPQLYQTAQTLTINKSL
jgi:hypothetical protein